MFRRRPLPAAQPRLAIALFVTVAIACMLLLSLSWLSAPEWGFYVVIVSFPLVWVVAASLIDWRAND